MKKIFLFIVIFSMLFKAVYGSEPFFITTLTNQVGPGVIHRKIIEPNEPWTLNVLEIDLTNPNINVESIKAGDRLGVKLPIRIQAENHSYEGHMAVGAINADYSSGPDHGWPVNSQVVNGEIVKLEWVNPDNPIYWPTIAFDENNKPSLEINAYSSRITANSTFTDISEINRDRGTNDLILYNSFHGVSTDTDNNGTEILISPLYGWFVNDTIQCIVESIESGIGNMAIPVGKAVLSGNGTESTFLEENISLGDTIQLFLGLIPSISKLKHLVGGFPTIIKNGQNYAVEGYYEEGGASTFHTDLHPRTAVGFSADSTKLYFITVDGRQSISRGMNLIELADFMVSIGVYKGMNLDGGGSTTMIVRDKVENSPSDGSERYLRNSLVVFTDVPEGILTHIQCEPDYTRLFIGESIRFIASGWDQYYNPVEINLSELNFSVDNQLGNIDEDGLYTVSCIGDSGWVYMNYNDLIDSAYIYLKSISQMSISPKVCIIDTIQTVNFKVEIVDEDGKSQRLQANQINWQSLNPEVGVIDSLGVFKGKSEGTTEIIASCYGFSDTAIVMVEVCEGIVSLDPMDETTNWSISGLNYDAQATVLSVVDTPRTYGTGSFQVDYQFTRLATERGYIYLNTDIYVNGIPESIDFDFFSDGAKHKAYVIVSDGDDELFKSTISGYAQDTTKFDTLSALTSKLVAVNTGSNLNYPIRIKQIQIRLGTSAGVGEINSGTIYFDNLRVIYPSTVMINPLDEGVIPEDFYLFKNYPNPFNATTVIPFRIGKAADVKLTVYDMVGNEVRTLVDERMDKGSYNIDFDAAGLATGMYVYRLETNGLMFSKKMMFVK
ncbi:MAG: phosphodiester glycosidase family protein [Candidatus Marinimicrobia bacterium]|nr:phosphodiester glycosidase family protein [Candidatus Neomarinimicrobiota bacterium]